MVLKTLEHGLQAALIGLRVLHARWAGPPAAQQCMPRRLQGLPA